MPLLAFLFRPHRFTDEQATTPAVPPNLNPQELRQSITDRLELLLGDLRDPQEFICPKARKEARSLVANYMDVAWDLGAEDMAKLESQWSNEFKSVDSKKSKAWSLLTQEDKDGLEYLELSNLEAVKAEITVEAVALEYAEDLAGVKDQYEKTMAMEEDMRPRGWQRLEDDLMLYERIGKVVEKMLGSQQRWAALQAKYRKWVDTYAQEREKERMQDEEDLVRGRELSDRAVVLEDKIGGLENQRPSEKEIEVLWGESRELQKEIETYEEHVKQRNEEVKNLPWMEEEEEWQGRLQLGRGQFVEEISDGLSEFESIIQRVEFDEEVESGEEVDTWELKALEDKGKTMLEVGWPRVVSR